MHIDKFIGYCNEGNKMNKKYYVYYCNNVRRYTYTYGKYTEEQFETDKIFKSVHRFKEIYKFEEYDEAKNKAKELNTNNINKIEPKPIPEPKINDILYTIYLDHRTSKYKSIKQGYKITEDYYHIVKRDIPENNVKNVIDKLYEENNRYWIYYSKDFKKYIITAEKWPRLPDIMNVDKFKAIRSAANVSEGLKIVGQLNEEEYIEPRGIYDVARYYEEMKPITLKVSLAPPTPAPKKTYYVYISKHNGYYVYNENYPKEEDRIENSEIFSYNSECQAEDSVIQRNTEGKFIVFCDLLENIYGISNNRHICIPKYSYIDTSKRVYEYFNRHEAEKAVITLNKTGIQEIKRDFNIQTLKKAPVVEMEPISLQPAPKKTYYVYISKHNGYYVYSENLPKEGIEKTRNSTVFTYDSELVAKNAASQRNNKGYFLIFYDLEISEYRISTYRHIHIPEYSYIDVSKKIYEYDNTLEAERALKTLKDRRKNTMTVVTDFGVEAPKVVPPVSTYREALEKFKKTYVV